MTERVTKSYLMEPELNTALLAFAKANGYGISECACEAFREFLERRGALPVSSDTESE